MDITSVLEFISSQLTTKKLKTLSTLETTVLKEAWKGKDGKSYDEIGNSEYLDGGSVKTAAYKLWRRLSNLSEEKVNRDNVQAVVERYYNKVAIASPPTPTPPAPNAVESNSAIAIPEDVTNSNINFIGRESAIAHLKTKINQGAKIILIQASAGIGKTTLATEFITTQNFDKTLYLMMAKEKENISPIESIVEEWLKKDFEEEPGRDFIVSLGRLKRQLQTRKIGILIDNLEPALDEDGRFIESHRSYVELLRVLADSMVQSVTLITSRERLCESDLNFEPYRLPELNYSAWKQYFEYSKININDSILMEMHKVYGGNAKVMRILCGAVQEDFHGDIEAYWELNKADVLAKSDLKNLVNSQFKRLLYLDINTFKLLCRLGCYRYQDVPTVPYNGLLCLLWDVPEGEQRRVIESLKNRSLVEFKKGEFFLHPMVREEAIAHLRKSTDWETANIQAAEFWTDSVETVETIQDGLTALEAYYHYVEIKDWNNAGIVFIRQINNKNNTLNKTEPLAREFYRLGVGQRIIILLNQIIEFITCNYVLSENYMILGDCYSQLGEISKAINSYLMLENFSTNQNEFFSESKYNFKSKKVKLNAAYILFNLGFCYIRLGEYEKSLDCLEKFTLIYEENYKNLFFDEYDIADLLSMMAFLHSLKGNQKQSLKYGEAAYKQLQTAKLDIWGIGSSFLFLASTYKNLNLLTESLNLYQQALQFATTNDYFIAQAIALTGLGELYRMQGEFSTALTHHQESIEILEQIGAKCDLAEAYYQLALTYQQMGDKEKSQPNFEKAIKLFKEIEAPRRVERVRKSIIDET